MRAGQPVQTLLPSQFLDQHDDSPPPRPLNRDSPGDPRTGVNNSNFPASSGARREVRMATGLPGSPNGGRGTDLPFSLALGRTSLICEHSDAKGRAADTKEPTLPIRFVAKALRLVPAGSDRALRRYFLVSVSI